MTQECRGRCDLLETSPVNRLAYEKGYKWCTVCNIFVKTSEIFCPCCNTQLRKKSHQKKSKEFVRY